MKFVQYRSTVCLGVNGLAALKTAGARLPVSNDTFPQRPQTFSIVTTNLLCGKPAELVQVHQEIVAGVSRVLKGITTANAQVSEQRRNRRIDTTSNTEKELGDSSTVGDSLSAADTTGIRTSRPSAGCGSGCIGTQRCRQAAVPPAACLRLAPSAPQRQHRHSGILVPVILEPFGHVSFQVVIFLCRLVMPGRPWPPATAIRQVLEITRDMNRLHPMFGVGKRAGTNVDPSGLGRA